MHAVKTKTRNPIGTVDKEEKIIYHSRIKNGQRRYTIVGVIIGKQLRIGYSVASENDQFVKELGRTIAHGRALKKPKSTLSILESDDNASIRKQFMSFAKNFPVLCSELVIPKYN